MTMDEGKRIDTNPRPGYPDGRWIQTNSSGQPVIPGTNNTGAPWQKATATRENAMALNVRLKFIRDKIIPNVTCESVMAMKAKAQKLGRH